MSFNQREGFKVLDFHKMTQTATKTTDMGTKTTIHPQVKLLKTSKSTPPPTIKTRPLVQITAPLKIQVNSNSITYINTMEMGQIINKILYN
jgi:hypothetical protein